MVLPEPGFDGVSWVGSLLGFLGGFLVVLAPISAALEGVKVLWAWMVSALHGH